MSGPRRVRDHPPADEAEVRLRHRFAIINVWRPLGAPVETAPLALCDAESVYGHGHGHTYVEKPEWGDTPSASRARAQVG